MPIPFLRATDISPIALLSDNVLGGPKLDDSGSIAVEAIQELFTSDAQSKKGRNRQTEVLIFSYSLSLSLSFCAFGFYTVFHSLSLSLFLSSLSCISLLLPLPLPPRACQGLPLTPLITQERRVQQEFSSRCSTYY